MGKYDEVFNLGDIDIELNPEDIQETFGEKIGEPPINLTTVGVAVASGALGFLLIKYRQTEFVKLLAQAGNRSLNFILRLIKKIIQR